MEALKWLKPTDPKPLYEANRVHREEGTCEWILDHYDYKLWRDVNGKTHVWVVGIPGTPLLADNRNGLF